MSHYITRYCEKHGEWDEDVDSPAEACPECIKDGSYITREQMQRLFRKATGYTVEEYIAMKNEAKNELRNLEIHKR